MKRPVACVAVLAVAVAALAMALGIRRLSPLLAEQWGWVAWIVYWLWERRSN